MKDDVRAKILESLYMQVASVSEEDLKTITEGDYKPVLFWRHRTFHVCATGEALKNIEVRSSKNPPLKNIEKIGD